MIGRDRKDLIRRSERCRAILVPKRSVQLRL
jgi:hypothetical protein